MDGSDGATSYGRKLRQMRAYLPFLERMIAKLERSSDRSRDPQLGKMRSLRQVLTDEDKKLRMDTLVKCEDVLKKLYEKVEGPTAPKPGSPDRSHRQTQGPQGSQGSHRSRVISSTPRSPDSPPTRRASRVPSTPRSPSPETRTGRSAEREQQEDAVRNSLQQMAFGGGGDDHQGREGGFGRGRGGRGRGRGFESRFGQRASPWMDGSRMGGPGGEGHAAPAPWMHGRGGVGVPRRPKVGGGGGPRPLFDGSPWLSEPGLRPRMPFADDRIARFPGPPPQGDGLLPLPFEALRPPAAPFGEQGHPEGYRPPPGPGMQGREFFGGPPHHHHHLAGPFGDFGESPDADLPGGGGGPDERFGDVRGGGSDFGSSRDERDEEERPFGGFPNRFGRGDERRQQQQQQQFGDRDKKGRFERRPGHEEGGGFSGPHRGDGPSRGSRRGGSRSPCRDGPPPRSPPRSPAPSGSFGTPRSPVAAADDGTPASPPASPPGEEELPPLQSQGPKTIPLEKTKVIPLERQRPRNKSGGGEGHPFPSQASKPEDKSTAESSRRDQDLFCGRRHDQPSPVIPNDLQQPDLQPESPPNPAPSLAPFLPPPPEGHPRHPRQPQPQSRFRDGGEVGDGLLPMPRVPPMDPFWPQQQGPPPPPPPPPHALIERRNAPPFLHRHRQDRQSHRPERPSTYGEYRKMKEERDRKMREHREKMEGMRQRAEEEEEVEKPRDRTRESSDPRGARGEAELRSPNVEALAKFKIPKKRQRPSTEDRAATGKEDSGEKTSENTCRKTSLSGRKESESDSESEQLKIVVDHESQSDSDDVPGTQKDAAVEERVPVESDPAKGAADGSDRQVENSAPFRAANSILQSLAASLEPKEAEKLLRKAAKMKNAEKLSLKQLKFLLLDDSDSEGDDGKVVVKEEIEKEEIVDKKDMKKCKNSRQVKKSPSARAQKPAPIPGTRRSKRLNQPDDDKMDIIFQDEDPTGSLEDDDEDQLVIDEDLHQSALDKVDSAAADDDSSSRERDEVITSPRGRGRGRGRGRRGRGGRQAVASSRGRRDADVSIQDDSVSSSTQRDEEEEEGEEDEAPVKTEGQESASVVKEEEEVEKEEEEAPQQHKSGRTATRGRRAGAKKPQGPKKKSKTWFPESRYSNFGGKAAVDRGGDVPLLGLKSAPAVAVAVPKREPKDVDQKVFLGSEEVVALDEEVRPRREASFSHKSELQAKLAAMDVSGLLKKLKKLDKEEDGGEEKQEAVNSKEQKGGEDESVVAVPPVVAEKDLGPFVVTEKASRYSGKMADLVAELKGQVGHVADESLDLRINHTDRVNLLGLVREWNHCHERKKEGEEEGGPGKVGQESCVGPAPVRLDMYTRHKLSRNPSAPSSFKDPAAFSRQMSSDRVGLLFKCFALGCDFASDDAGTFVSHLRLRHEGRAEAALPASAGWRCCVYCNLAYRTPEKLASHVVAIHGSCRYQCPHCYYRAGSQVALLVHQHALHPDRERGFVRCRAAVAGDLLLLLGPAAKLPPLHCRASPSCRFVCGSASELSAHLRARHGDPFAEHTEILCCHCGGAFNRVSLLVLHCVLMHASEAVVCGVRHIDLRQELIDDLAEEEDLLAGEETYDCNSSSGDDEDGQGRPDGDELLGEESVEADSLEGEALFRCGNVHCQFRAAGASAFRHHLTVCDLSNSVHLSCWHCGKQLKHAPTLVEHLVKAHGPRRYSCSLCGEARASTAQALRGHMRTAHRVSYAKTVPLDPARNDPEADRFLLVPKNATPRQPAHLPSSSRSGGGGSSGNGNSNSNSSSKGKDTFSPLEVDSLPHPSMSRNLLRCTECDFSTRVRRNLEKHLRLHLRRKKAVEERRKKKLPAASGSPCHDDDEEKGGEGEQQQQQSVACVPAITPINAPTVVDPRSEKATKMSNLLDCDSEEYTRPMSNQDLAAMPAFVPESARFACCEDDCQYYTIDAVMLLYHIQALHPTLEAYNCPHCRPGAEREEEEEYGVDVDFDDLEFHLRCHGDLLFKCGHCRYYHWQKRTAEAHVADVHPERKQFVRNVRMEAEEKARIKRDREKRAPATRDSRPSVVSRQQQPHVYLPFKCGLCDAATETEEAVRRHSSEVHGFRARFKCVHCAETGEDKAQLEAHTRREHGGLLVGDAAVARVFYIDQYSSDGCSAEERHLPLWSRDMPGVKHIRGILYEDDDGPETRPVPSTIVSARKKSKFQHHAPLQAPTKDGGEDGKGDGDEADNFPMKCKECGIYKKTIRALKMHIKLLHLRTGKFRCKMCQYSANVLVSIHTHYKIKHADAAENPDFEERPDEQQVLFNHDFWKAEWGIPTLAERRAMVIGTKQSTSSSSPPPQAAEREGAQVPMPRQTKRKKGGALKAAPVAKKGKRKAVKRKAKADDGDDCANPPTQSKSGPPTSSCLPAPTTSSAAVSVSDVPTISQGQAEAQSSLPSSSASAVADKKAMERIMEISPFETTPTFKCLSCPKRSQSVERMRRHLEAEHPDKSGEDEGTAPHYKTMTRDQVVDLLTLRQEGAGQDDFQCFYCDDVVGGILDLQAHFGSAHRGDALKVKSGQGKGVNGYLECQLCGHLTPGFERSKQKVHFHEEHPLESAVNASKYVSKPSGTSRSSSTSSLASAASSTTASTSRSDLSRFNGTPMACPREGCDFRATALSAVNSHLRRHTQTFKCGHCGKTHASSSEFHRHSAMMHGDKIPDQVKDPEAEAELDALKALFEAELLRGERHLSSEERGEDKPGEVPPAAKKQPTARKSTTGKATPPRPAKLQTARKSTGGGGSSAGRRRRHQWGCSVYGVPFEAPDLASVTTRMALGGMVEMTVSADKMAELVNLAPKVLVRDIKSKLPS